MSGLGEKFSPDLFTGTGNFSVPVALPPGRNGFQPELTLGYSTGGGNSAFGLGWNLSVPGVTRKTSKGIPRYDDTQDVFILSGAEDLVPLTRTNLEDENGRTVGFKIQYRPRTEGLFARIEHYRYHNHRNYWQVWNKDGLISYYGDETEPVVEADTEGNLHPNRRNQAVVADPEHPTNVFSWHLTRTVDAFGNVIVYEYERVRGLTGSHRYEQCYLQRIRYADYGPQTAARQFLVSVQFAYADVRPDAFSTYDAGFEVRTTQRCTHIRTFTHPQDADLPVGHQPNRVGNGPDTVAVKTYALRYLDEFADQLPALNGASLLHQVTVTGHNAGAVDGPQQEQMPPLTFGYSNFAPLLQRFFPVTGELPGTSLASPDLDLVDLFGRGLPDVVQLGGGVARYWRNLGGGRFDQPREMKDAPGGLQLADPDVQFIDANGDGKVDLLVNRDGLAGYFPLRFDGLWDRNSFRRYRQRPSFSFADPEVRLLDLDGDGVTDVLRNGSRLEYFYQDAEQGFTRVQQVNKGQLDDFPNVSFQDPRVRLGRLCGGLQCLALVHNGRVEYWPNLGRGRWGRRVAMHNSPRLPFGFNPARLLLGDLDGDGLDDLVYVEDNQVTLWINRSGNAWSAPIVITGTPAMTDASAVRITDLLGTGVPGILWTRDAPAVGREQQYLFLDLTGKVKPYVLHQMDNNLGAVTRVEYASSTHYYQEDARRPDTRWRTPLPFPVQVVSRVEVVDLISGGKMATEYRYHHGYWDGGEREFRGFGRVDQRDTETFQRYNSPGLHADADLSPLVRIRGDFATADFAAADFLLDATVVPPRPADEATTALPVAAAHYAPPLETRTWFHLGPVGDAYGEWQELDLTYEYWSGDAPLLQRPAGMQELIRQLPRRQRRDAYRTLRGTTLRTELYARDGSARQNRPYTVTESLSGVALVRHTRNAALEARLVFAPGQGPDSLAVLISDKPIFFAHGLAQRTTQWERGDDPMTQLAFTDDYDNYGQARRQTSLAMPRGWHRTENPSAVGALVTHAITAYVGYGLADTHSTYDKATQYMTDRVARSTSYEVLTDVLPVSADDPSVRIGPFALHQLIMAQHPEQSAPNPAPAFALTFNIIGQSLQYYDGPAFLGGNYNTLGAYGALTRSEVLMLTEDIIQQAYGDTPPELEAAPVWPAEYPAAFRDAYAAAYPGGRAGYHVYQDANHLPGGYYQQAERRQYDFQLTADPAEADPFKQKAGPNRGLVRAMLDALGNANAAGTGATEARVSRVRYDAYALLPVATRDALGHQTAARYDYRVLQAWLVTDPNQNRTAYGFTPLGLLHETAVLGKQDAGEGDIVQEATATTPLRYQASTYLEYDFFAFIRGGQPAWVRTTQREQHVTVQAESDTLCKTEYSDGFGRLLQTRTQAEDVLFGDETLGDSGLPADPAAANGPAVGRQRPPGDPLNVVVSGWQVYDNKGRVVEKYEPFFAQGFDYAPATLAQRGQRVRLFYDPRGQLVRTVNPDGTEQRVYYGMANAAGDLSKLAEFRPTPWETYTYDANDLAPLTHPDGETGPVRHHVDPAHYYTPQSALVDALGRTVQTTDRLHPTDETRHVVMHYGYDIRGNRMQVTDPLKRVSFRHVYDLKPKAGEDAPGANVLWTQHLDGGTRTALFDGAGQPLRGHDAKGALTLHAYDPLGRPRDAWARDQTGEVVTRRQHLRYGTDAATNTVGQLVEHYDEAGRQRLLAFDFKGNPLAKERQVMADDVLLQTWQAGVAGGWQTLPAATVVNWDQLDEARLAERVYPTNSRYDVLNRAVEVTLPPEATGQRPVLTPSYNRAGSLEQVALDGEIIVRHVAYNARGQRLLLARANGVLTRYAYDEVSFRLRRLRSERYTVSGLSFAPQGSSAPQDTTYRYDLAGNIVALTEHAPQSGVGGTDELERLFGYDALYRLLSATGRENQPTAATPWQDSTRSDGVQSTTAYTQHYQYDLLGNIEQLQHVVIGSSNNGFTRRFVYAATDNRLRRMEVGSDTLSYQYDANGNVTQENNSRHFQWDAADQLRAFATWTGAGSAPTLLAYYQYSGGQRVKKLTQTGINTWQVTVYVEGMEHRYEVSNSSMVEQTQVHILDGQSRIYQRRTGDALGDQRPAELYGLDDHLGSVAAQLTNVGNLVSREEFFPFGETSFGGHEKQRYRFCGKERDQESGLYYYGMRYYAAWLCRFISVDPLAAKYPFYTPFQYAGNKPINATDLDGAEEQPKVDSGGQGSRSSNINPLVAASDATTVVKSPALLPPQKIVGAAPKPTYLSQGRRSDIQADYNRKAIQARKVAAAYSAGAGIDPLLAGGGANNPTGLVSNLHTAFKEAPLFFATEGAAQWIEGVYIMRALQRARSVSAAPLTAGVARSSAAEAGFASWGGEFSHDFNSFSKPTLKVVGQGNEATASTLYGVGYGELSGGKLSLWMETRTYGMTAQPNGEQLASGREVFSKIFSTIEANSGTGSISVIEGSWSYGDNLATFNRLADRLGDVEAAKKTFTGLMAKEHGFVGPVKVKRGVTDKGKPWVTVQFYKF